MTDRNEPRRAGGDPLGTLLEAAGKRPAVPQEREARARAAAHDEWRRLVERRRAARRRRFVPLAAAAGIALAAFAAWWWVERTGRPEAPATAAIAEASMTVERVIGAATWRGLEETSARTDVLAVDARLRPGVELLTASDGRVSFTLDGGHSLRIDRDTRLVWESDGRWRLAGGAIYVASPAFAAADPSADHPPVPGDAIAGFVVDTPFGRLVETGTQFEVRVGSSMTVRLREGAVRWRPRVDGDVERTVTAGRELEVRGDGDTTERAIAAADPAWRWASELSPAIDLEDRTVSEVLGLLAREHGVTWRFEDPALPAAARDIRLTGVELPPGTTLDDALDTVLPVVGWTRGESAEPGVVAIRER